LLRGIRRAFFSLISKVEIAFARLSPPFNLRTQTPQGFWLSLALKDEIKTIIEKTVTKFGNGAKIDCPKEYIGKKAYILIRE